MKFIISGKNIEVTEGIKAAIEEKLGRLDKYLVDDTIVNVTLSVQKGRQKIEVTIPMKGHIIRKAKILIEAVLHNGVHIKIIEPCKNAFLGNSQAPCQHCLLQKFI